MTRSPGTGARLLLFLVALSGAWVLMLTGFPPGAPDRLPVLLIALALAFLTARRREWGVVAFAFLFPCAGLLVRLFGATDPSTWPTLLFAGLATGWTFRFLYDFESVSEPSALDPWLKALLAVWLLSTVLAVGRARTLWAAFRGLSGRAVNGDGLLDEEAIRESVFSFSALAAGAVFYFLLRRSSLATRERAARAAVWGVTASSVAALLQRLHLLPAEARGFWRLTGRLSGGAIDPNSLGLLCGMAIVLALTRGVRRGARGADFVAVIFLIGGLLLSGSRSGFLLVLLSLAVLAIARGLPPRVRWAGIGALTAILVLLAVLVVRASPGTLGSRIAESFDTKLPLEYRASARPVLWQAAGRLFLRHPIAGEGMGSFAWRLPDLLMEENRRLAMRDNPGSSYVQALAEIGLPGFLLTIAFAAALASFAFARIRSLDRDPLAGSAAVALIAFLLASVFGSHWYAADGSLFFFLLAAVATPAEKARPKRWPGVFRALAVGVAGVAALAGVIATARPETTFRYSPRIGFYDKEDGPRGSFRWTKKNFALWIEPGRVERVRLTHQLPIEGDTELILRLDGRRIWRETFSPGQSAVLRLNPAAQGPRAFCFALSKAVIPRRLRLGEDRRELGFQAELE